jgi:CelD/BcsL family acetyltransferase involved in cellulose biosynthesis
VASPISGHADHAAFEPAKSEHCMQRIARPPCQFSLEPILDLDAVAAQWVELESIAKPSLFLSWGWVGIWLENLPADIAPNLLVARVGDRVVGLAVINRYDRVRYGWLKSKGLFLHETGNTSLDTLTVEYNGILVAPDYATDILAQALAFLGADLRDWDEFFISGLPENELSTVELAGTSQHVWDFKPCDYVDLVLVRDSGRTYLEHLSRNTRQQIRRALRAYEKIGPVEARSASSVDEALEFLDNLKGFHQV